MGEPMTEVNSHRDCAGGGSPSACTEILSTMHNISPQGWDVSRENGETEKGRGKGHFKSTQNWFVRAFILGKMQWMGEGGISKMKSKLSHRETKPK